MNQTAKIRRSNNRAQALLDSAAHLFATRGYKETTLREIGARIDMLPGSVYYHFESKQALLLAVYEQAVDSITGRLDAAIVDIDDPWQKLEAAVVAHIQTITDCNDYARVMVGVIPGKVPELKAELTALRDGYEQKFTRLVRALPLERRTNRSLMRLMLLGAMNSVQAWYQPIKDNPSRIAREFVRYLRQAV